MFKGKLEKVFEASESFFKKTGKAFEELSKDLEKTVKDIKEEYLFDNGEIKIKTNKGNIVIEGKVKSIKLNNKFVYPK